ncbi:MAG TPA: serine hydrolase [Thermoanaerobaculia bacterium]
MPTKVCLLVLAILLVFGASSAQTSAPDPLASRVDAVFAEYDKPDSPGCAVGVYRDGRTAYSRGYGMANLEHGIPITPRTVFYTGSVSKQFTAFSVALLAQQGKISLDDDVRKYVPELPDYGTPITIRHLIHHTSGLREKWLILQLAGWREGDLVTQRDIVDLASRQKALNFKPGDQHSYSNTGYDLLSTLVERASGKPLSEYARENLFAPLGMKDSRYVDDRTAIVPRRAHAYAPRDGGGFGLDLPNVETTGSGSVYSTIEDLARWDENFVTAKVGGKTLLEQVQTPGVLNDGTKLDYAFGLGVDQDRGLKRVWHNGALAGFRAMFLQYPEQHLSVAVLCNLGSADPDTLALRTAEIYLADKLGPSPAPPQAAEPAAVPVSAAELDRFAGLYFDEEGGLVRRIAVKDGKAFYQRGPGNETELIPVGPGRFAMKGVPQRVDLIFEPGRMTFQTAGQPPTLFRAVEPVASLDAAALARYAGTYASDELGATWTLAVRDGRLVFQRQRFEDEPLTPAFTDAFTAGGLLFRFARGEGGAVTGFSASTSGVRDIRFVRVER